MELLGRTVIVTGATSGIGEATAIAAAGRGARVAAVGRRRNRLEILARRIPGTLPIVADLTDPRQVSQIADAVHRQFGRIDVLVNAAGRGTTGPIETMSIDDLWNSFELNTIAPLLMMRAVAPYMRQQVSGAIVNVSCFTTRMLLPGLGGLSASKAALEALSAAARLELAGDGITVSTVVPYLTQTEFATAALETTNVKGPVFDPGWNRRTDALSPSAVAEAILELIDDGEAETVLMPNVVDEFTGGWVAPQVAVGPGPVVDVDADTPTHRRAAAAAE